MKNKLYSLAAISGASLIGTLSILASPQIAQALTFVLDFKEPSQGTTADAFGIQVDDFNVTDFGFNASDFGTVTNAIFNKVQSHFHDIPTVSQYGGDPDSPIPDGKELDIDFEIGDLLPANGTIDFTPANPDDAADPVTGIGDYYFVQVGNFNSDPGNALKGSTTAVGFAINDVARNDLGTANPNGATGNTLESIPVASIFTDRINSMVLSSPNQDILTDPPGNLEATVNAIAGTISHEIGHTLTLDHVYDELSETAEGSPLMGTNALDLANDSRILDRSFSFSGFGEVPEDPEGAEGIDGIALSAMQPLADIPAGSPGSNNVQQLVDAVGTRDSAAVPFEFSPAMGLLLVGSTWGFATWRKKSQLKDLSK